MGRPHLPRSARPPRLRSSPGAPTGRFFMPATNPASPGQGVAAFGMPVVRFACPGYGCYRQCGKTRFSRPAPTARRRAFRRSYRGQESARRTVAAPEGVTEGTARGAGEGNAMGTTGNTARPGLRGKTQSGHLAEMRLFPGCTSLIRATVCTGCRDSRFPAVVSLPVCFRIAPRLPGAGFFHARAAPHAQDAGPADPPSDGATCAWAA